MSSTQTVRLKTYVLLVLMVVFSSLGNILLSKGMKQIGSVSLASPASLGQTFVQTVHSGTIWLGITGLLLFFVCYLLVLSWADFSFVQPATAGGYALVPLLGYIILGETVPLSRWLGVACICLGVLLVSYTPLSTTEAR